MMNYLKESNESKKIAAGCIGTRKPFQKGFPVLAQDKGRHRRAKIAQDDPRDDSKIRQAYSFFSAQAVLELVSIGLRTPIRLQKNLGE